MEISTHDPSTKQLLTEIIIELMQSKREVFYEIILEAFEEIGLTQAIIEGRENKFVSEAEIFSLLDEDVM